jgi:hypothetical protein
MRTKKAGSEIYLTRLELEQTETERLDVPGYDLGQICSRGRELSMTCLV